MLEPLQQFICDNCNQVIEKPEDSYLEWLVDKDKKAHGFKIVHHFPKSPLKEKNETGCYCHVGKKRRKDDQLQSYTDREGISYLLQFIDIGPFHDPDFDEVNFKNGREFAELFRRLQVPYYEEARLYWEEARNDGFFDGQNEIKIYSPQNLKILVETYGNF